MTWTGKIFGKSKQSSFADQQSKLEVLEKKAHEALLRGDGEAAFLLGNAFNDVDDPNYIKNPPYDVCKHNTAKAKHWLEKAVSCNHPDAMVVLGLAYCEGGGMVAKDFNYGVEMLKKAKSIGTNPPEMADLAITNLFNQKLNNSFA